MLAFVLVVFGLPMLSVGSLLVHNLILMDKGKRLEDQSSEMDWN